MLSSVIREKLDVLQILQVWSAEQVARSLGWVQSVGCHIIALPTLHPLPCIRPDPSCPQSQADPYARGIRAKAALQGIACVRWDLGLGDELGHFITNAPCQIPDVTVSL